MSNCDVSEISKLMDKNKCWTCKKRLNQVDKSSWKCTKCSNVYYSCKRCEDENGHPFSYDWYDNDKGIFCKKCEFHFCISCWQNVGLFDDSDDEYICENCAIFTKSETEQHKQTTVVNVKVSNIRPQYKNLEEWMSDSNNVYIGRRCIVFIDGKRFPSVDSPWCNPFKITDSCNREKVIKLYKKYITKKISSGELDIEELRGKNLGCWCKPNLCHGDVLVELLQNNT
jgi:hypothetical protein